MPATIAVYNPDDEELEFRFDGKPYTLKAQDVTEIPRASLGVMLSQIGEFGVTPIPTDTSRTELDQLVKKAKERWHTGVRKWAEDLVLDSAKSNQARVASGLKAIESKDVAWAREWLQKNGYAK